MNVSTSARVAAYNSEVAVAVAAFATKTTAMAGLVTTESDTASLLSALVNQEDEDVEIARETVPSTETGRNVDLRA